MPRKKFTITLPESVFNALTDWAERMGGDRAGHSSYLLQKAVDDAVEAGLIPKYTMDEDSQYSDAALEPLPQAEWDSGSDRLVLDYLFSDKPGCKRPQNGDIYDFCVARGLSLEIVKAQIDAKAKECCEATQ